MTDNFNKKVLYSSVILSSIIFIFLSCVIGLSLILYLYDIIENITGYAFIVSLNITDYFMISFIPLWAVLINQKKKEFMISKFLLNIGVISMSCIVFFSFSLIILLTNIGRLECLGLELLPEHWRVQPFPFYSSIFIAFGISFPFLILSISNEKS